MQASHKILRGIVEYMSQFCDLRFSIVFHMKDKIMKNRYCLAQNEAKKKDTKQSGNENFPACNRRYKIALFSNTISRDYSRRDMWENVKTILMIFLAS